MLKYFFFAFFIGITSPCFCIVNQINNADIATISKENKLKSLKKLSFLKSWTKKRKFPIFGVISLIAGLLGLFLAFIEYVSWPEWINSVGFILIFAGILLGIVGLIVGEFALWSILGILVLPLAILSLLILYGVSGTKSC
jgi:hypothetical protein